MIVLFSDLSHLNQLDRYGADVKCTSQVLGYCSYIGKKFSYYLFQLEIQSYL